jgi:hypothetical protein
MNTASGADLTAASQPDLPPASGTGLSALPGELLQAASIDQPVSIPGGSPGTASPSRLVTIAGRPAVLHVSASIVTSGRVLCGKNVAEFEAEFEPEFVVRSVTGGASA